MGAITKATQAVQQRPQNTFRELVKTCAPQFKNVMPKGFSADRLIQMSIAAYSRTPKLNECSNTSILSCCLQCATLGLEPSAVDGLGNAYIIPRWNGKTKTYEAQFQLGKNGMLALVRRSGEVKTIRTQVVYEGDDFDYWEDESGVHFNYRPNVDAPHDVEHMRLVYLSCHLKDGGFVFLTMSKPEIDAIMERTTSKDRNGNITGPWSTDYVAMAEKTVIRRAFNRGMLPRSVEVAHAVAQDETTPVVLDSDGYEVFGHEEHEPVEVDAHVDAETGEIVEPDVAETVAAPAPLKEG